jgi:hypothetical protein
MTKQKVLIISATGVALFILGIIFLMNDVCSVDAWVRCRNIDESVGFIVTLLMYTIPVFIFSLLTYFLREETFRTWLRLTSWFIPVSMILVLVSSNRDIPGGGNLIPSASPQDLVGVFTWGLYILVSLVIIIWKYFATRRSK